MISDIEPFFISLLANLYVLFGEVSIQVLCPFFHWIFGFFGVEFYKFFINFGYEPIIRCISKYILPLGGLPFHFIDGFLCFAENFVV